jgi:hypothetical protein
MKATAFARFHIRENRGQVEHWNCEVARAGKDGAKEFNRWVAVGQFVCFVKQKVQEFREGLLILRAFNGHQALDA